MFERFDAIVYKVSEYCNLDCVYCFQKHDVKERTRGFTYFDELIKLLITLPLANDIVIRLDKTIKNLRRLNDIKKLISK